MIDIPRAHHETLFNGDYFGFSTQSTNRIFPSGFRSVSSRKLSIFLFFSFFSQEESTSMWQQKRRHQSFIWFHFSFFLRRNLRIYFLCIERCTFSNAIEILLRKEHSFVYIRFLPSNTTDGWNGDLSARFHVRYGCTFLSPSQLRQMLIVRDFPFYASPLHLVNSLSEKKRAIRLCQKEEREQIFSRVEVVFPVTSADRKKNWAKSKICESSFLPMSARACRVFFIFIFSF